MPRAPPTGLASFSVATHSRSTKRKQPRCAALRMQNNNNSCVLGIDVGGTFTDLVMIRLADGKPFLHKTPSTPADPSIAMERGITEILASASAQPAEVSYFGHGTTVATNALIEGKTSNTALITTQGFRDILEIRRQRQPHNYNIRIPKPRPPVPRHLRREMNERTFLMGRDNIAPSRAELDQHIAALKEADIASVAV